MFVKKIDEKIKLILVIIFILFAFIICRVVYIQMFDYGKLKKLATNLWTRDLPIEADRGLILDRNGVILANNLTTTSLVLIPNQIEDKEKTSTLLANILGVSKKEMDKHVNKVTSIERVHPEGRRLSYEIADKIENLKLEGVYLVKESKRNYPFKDNLSHVLGYVGIDNQGLSGIELEYDKYLTGEKGAIKYFSDAKGNKLSLSDIYVKPQEGMNVQLTIDYNIQKSLERELDNAVSMFDPDMALAVVIDPNNGEILGMSSRPGFDPNNYKNYTMEVLSRNLPIWASYEPGSTFKIMTTAAAVNEKVVDLFKDTFYDSGHVMVSNARINCWKPAGHGAQTFLQVLENSCNPGFVKMGNLLGKEKLFSYLDKFGFGSKTGIDLSGESTGIMFPLDKVGQLELATTAFGQGVSVTPIQQLAAISSVLNGGNLYRPFVVKNIIDPISSSLLVHNDKSLVRDKIITKETSDIMKYALESVVANGGGRSAFIEDYRIGGKTGTAQKVFNGRYMDNNYIMSFVGIVPANNPQAILYLAIDNPKKTPKLSSYTTTPMARRVLVDIIDALNIPKQEGALEKKYVWDDPTFYLVPNVIGKTIKEANSLLKPHFKVEYTGFGEKIIEQSPKDIRIAEGSTIRLLLG